MFKLFRDQWVVSKGIREVVMMGERDGFLRPEKREDTIKGILEFSRDSGIVNRGIPAHEQVMITVMAFFGIAMGSAALMDATRWATEYADRHSLRGALAKCTGTATGMIESATQAEGRR